MSEYEELLKDRLTFRFTQMKMTSLNSPKDFKVGDKVIVLISIDSHLNLDKMKPGMEGVISSIAHRYRGQPNEHFEYWVGNDISKSRYELNQIIRYDIAKDIIVKIG